MSDKTVTFKINVDTTQPQKSINSLEKELQELKLKFKSANIGSSEFTGLKTQISGIENQLKGVGTQTSQFGGILKGVGGIMAGAFAVSSIVSFGGAMLKAYDEEQQANAKLLTALDGRRDVTEELIQQSKRLQETTTYDNDETVAAMARMAAFVKEGDQIKILIPLVQDLAKAKGMDLAKAADMVARTVGTSSNALKRQGIEAEGAAGSNERLTSVVEGLTKAFGGQAEAAAQAGLGQIKQLKNTWGELMEVGGGLLAQAILPLASGLNDLTKKIVQLVEQPLSEKLQDENTDTNILIESILSLNQGNATRLSMLKELKIKYPELLQNIDIERISNTELRDILKDINNQYKIKAQQVILEEKLAPIQKKYTNELREQTSTVEEITKQYDLLIKDKNENATIEEKLMALQKLSKEDIKETDKVQQGAVLTRMRYIDELTNKYKESNEDLDNYNKQSSEIIQQQSEITNSETKAKEKLDKSTIEQIQNSIKNKTEEFNVSETQLQMIIDKRQEDIENYEDITRRKRDLTTALTQDELSQMDIYSKRTVAQENEVIEYEKLTGNKIQIEQNFRRIELKNQLDSGEITQSHYEKEIEELDKTLGILDEFQKKELLYLKAQNKKKSDEQEKYWDNVEKQAEKAYEKTDEGRAIQIEKEISDLDKLLKSKQVSQQEYDARLDEINNSRGIKTKEDADEWLETYKFMYDKGLIDLETYNKNVEEINSQKKDKPLKYEKEIDKIILEGKTILEQEELNYEERLKSAGLYGKEREDMTEDELEALETLEYQHIENVNQIKTDAILDGLEKDKEAFDLAATERETAYLNELTALGDNEEKKKELTDKYREDELKYQQEFMKKQLINLQAQIEASDLGMEGSILSDEEKENLNKKIIELKQLIAELTNQIYNEGNPDKKDLFGMTEEDWEKFNENFQKAVAVAQGIGEIWANINEIKSNKDEEQLQKDEKNAEARKKLLEKQLKNGIISQEKYDKEVEKLDEELDKKKRKIAYEQVKREKSQKIFAAAVNTASAVVGMLAAPPITFFNWIMAGMAAALGATQIAAISSTPLPEMKRGGVLKGPSHAEGGILTPFGELEGEEGVINKQSMLNPSLRNLASAANVAGGGVSFGIGSGEVKLDRETIMLIINGITNGVSNGVNNKKTYVLESDIRNTQSKVDVYESRASF